MYGNEFLFLLKPDAIQRRLVGEIISRVERAGFRIKEIRSGQPARSLAERHYAHLRALKGSAWERNVEHLSTSTVVMLVLQGPVAAMRKLVGATEPVLAEPGTIRGDYACDSIAAAEAESRGVQNLVHASDSPESGRAEVELWRQEFPGGAPADDVGGY